MSESPEPPTQLEKLVIPASVKQSWRTHRHARVLITQTFNGFKSAPCSAGGGWDSEHRSNMLTGAPKQRAHTCLSKRTKTVLYPKKAAFHSSPSSPPGTAPSATPQTCPTPPGRNRQQRHQISLAPAITSIPHSALPAAPSPSKTAF